MGKMKILFTVAMILAVASAGAAGPAAADAANRKPAGGEGISAVAGAGNAFALDLYARLAPKGKDNLFFSPASIHTALAMTYAGARGRTAEQMAGTLHFPFQDQRLHAAMAAMNESLNTPRLDRNKKPAYQLVVANALWGQKGYHFQKEFTELVKAHYGAGLNELDFRQSEPARKTINDWVADQTKDKIKNLIPQGMIGELTRLVLTNAIYFKANWAEKFEKRDTRDDEFKLSPGKTVTVAMMHQQKRYGYLETEAFQAVKLPYKYNDLSMVIFLPKKADGLAAFEKTLTAANLTRWMGRFKAALVRVTLPKFKFTSRFELGRTLAAMGMADAFSGLKADFSGMTGGKDLYISQVLHKAFVGVDEEGTEAAAATVVLMRLGSAAPRPEQPKIFRADHPFVFMIRHRSTGSILFLGRVTDPGGRKAAAKTTDNGPTK